MLDISYGTKVITLENLLNRKWTGRFEIAHIYGRSDQLLLSEMDYLTSKQVKGQHTEIS